MSTYIAPQPTLSEAWAETLEVVSAAGGRLVNVLTTVTEPGPEDQAIRAYVDGILVPSVRHGTTIYAAETVANTIFPIGLYRDVGFQWSPALDANSLKRLDDAAAGLYDAYSDMLPLLVTADGNHNGTYFGRMVSWPGKAAGGRNQLADRIRYLRIARETGKASNNLCDIAVGGEGDPGASDGIDDIGLQTYSALDLRQRGFPCLVHIDLTLDRGRLSLLAVYRHQYLVTKAYGNLLGLCRLLHFLAQQTGYAIGELAVQATLADDERGTYGGKTGISQLVSQTRALRATTEVK
ncbi:MAG: hypothetical protein ACYDAN_08170 [Candidatus Limnocylindrales bacterium]